MFKEGKDNAFPGLNKFCMHRYGQATDIMIFYGMATPDSLRHHRYLPNLPRIEVLPVDAQ